MSLFAFDAQLLKLAAQAEVDCETAFQSVEAVQQKNETKVLEAFIQNRVSESHFSISTGYGYGDRGRDVLDAVYATVFGIEDALVRHHFVSGTHALTVALFGILRPGDTLVSLVGSPYDTMEEVIGIRGAGNGSLRDFGVRYQQHDLLADGTVDMSGIPGAVQNAKMVLIQRSRGYTLRPSLTVAQIGEMVAAVKETNPDTIVLVDNCYGEFVEETEPSQVGADLVVGSLIKNPGGGIALTGGYIAGRGNLISLCAQRLTAPGVGKEAGCSLEQTRAMLLGLFFAPSVVGAALKTSCFAARLFSLLGFPSFPDYNQPRSDIITAIQLGKPELLKAFCRGIQSGSPVDAFVTPESWAMPGYESEVIMAAGAFTGGASIELSADAPLREPFTVWMQGGLTYHTAKLGVLRAAQEILRENQA